MMFSSVENVAGAGASTYIPLLAKNILVFQRIAPLL